MRTFFKFLMLLNAIMAVDTLLAPEFDFWRLISNIIGVVMMILVIVLLDTRAELTMFKFMQQVNRVLINYATHDEIDELRRQLNSGITGNAAKYTRELFEKYEKKDG